MTALESGKDVAAKNEAGRTSSALSESIQIKPLSSLRVSGHLPLGLGVAICCSCSGCEPSLTKANLVSPMMQTRCDVASDQPDLEASNRWVGPLPGDRYDSCQEWLHPFVLVLVCVELLRIAVPFCFGRSTDGRRDCRGWVCLSILSGVAAERTCAACTGPKFEDCVWL